MFDNFQDKEDYFFDENRNFIDEKLDNYFKEFKVDISEVGSCLEEKCNLMKNYCFEMNNISLKHAIEIPILPFVTCSTTIKSSVKKKVCVELGPVLYSAEEKKQYNSLDITISGDEDVYSEIDFGIHIPFSFSPIRLSFNFGLKGMCGSGRTGVKLSLYLKDKFSIDLYYEFRDHQLSYYLSATFKFDISIVKFSFSFYIFRIKFASSKIENHSSKEYKYSAALINDDDKVVFNGDRWEQKYSNTTTGNNLLL